MEQKSLKYITNNSFKIILQIKIMTIWVFQFILKIQIKIVNFNQLMMMIIIILGYYYIIDKIKKYTEQQLI